jgi:hypothetical protein
MPESLSTSYRSPAENRKLQQSEPNRLVCWKGLQREVAENKHRIVVKGEDEHPNELMYDRVLDDRMSTL